MSIHLESCLNKIINGENVQDPVVQILEISNTDGPAINIKISDGENYITAALKKEVYLNQIRNLKIFQLIKIQYELMERIIFINSIEINPLHIRGVIGHPTQLQIASSLPQQSNNILPINQIHQFIGPKHIIARVVFKSPPKTSRNNTHFFKIGLKDSSGEITGIFFDRTNSQIYDQIENNKVYDISNMIVKEKDERYSSDFGNSEYVLMFSNSTKFEEVEDDTIPYYNATFSTIMSISSIQDKKQLLSIYAVIVDVGEIQKITKENTQLKKRIVLLADDSSSTIKFVLWNDDADSISVNDADRIVKLTNVSLKIYQGKKELSKNDFSQFEIPKRYDDRMIQLSDWWERNKMNVGNFKHISIPEYKRIQMYNLPQIFDRISPNAPFFFECDVQFENLYKYGYYYYSNFINDSQNCSQIIPYSFPFSQNPQKPGPIIYIDTCPKCSIKMNEKDDGMYECPKCNLISNKPKVLYQFCAKVSDETGGAFIRVPQNNQQVGETLLGVSAEEWKKETDDMDKNQKIEFMKRIFGGKQFKIQCRIETKEYDSEFLTEMYIENIEKLQSL